MATKVNLVERPSWTPETQKESQPEDQERDTAGRFSASNVRKSVKHQFVYWLALPESLRQPKTQRDFSRQSGVSELTLWRWKNERVVVAEVEKLVNQYARSHFADVIYALVTAAEAGDIAAVKLYLQFVLGWREGEASDTCLERLWLETRSRVRPEP
jgi:hypothetical protein